MSEHTMPFVLIGLGAICLVGARIFYWYNLHTPLQTRLPAILFPVGAGLILMAAGGLVL